MYRRFIALVIRHPTWTVGLTLALTLALASQMAKLRAETDMNVFVPEHDDARANLDLLESVFGSSYLTRILIVRDDHPDGIYEPGTLRAIERITEWLRSRPEFETERPVDLRSFSTVNDIRGSDGEMVVEPFMEEPPSTREQALLLRTRLEENGIYVGVLASKTGKAAAIVVRESAAGRASRPATYRALRQFLDGLSREGRPERFHITGRPVVEGLFGLYIAHEALRMLPIVVCFLAIFLFVSFRTPRAVVIPMIIIAATEAWMMGFLGLCGWRVYSVTTILPVLMTAVAMADSIHLLARFYELREQFPSDDRSAIVEKTMTDMGLPIFMTSITTAIGFLTMVTTAVLPLREFGIVAAFGVAAALLLTVVLVPAMLALLPLPRPAASVSGAAPRFRRLDGALAAATRLSDRRPDAVVAGFGTIILVATVGLFRLSTDSSQIEQFRPSHHLRKADTVDNRLFAGSSFLDIVIDGGQIDAIQQPEMLERISKLQTELERLPEVGDSFSIAELVERMNRVMNGDRADMEAIPASRELVAQYLLLYSISGGPGDFDDLVDYDYRRAHVFVFINDSGTAAAKRVVQEAARVGRSLFPADPATGVDIRLAGSTYTNAHLEQHVINSQISTLLLGVPAMFLLMWWMLRSLSLALLSITPLSIAIVCIYGAMGLIGLPTDIATTLLGALAVGVGVDFSIHYLHCYLVCMREVSDPARAAGVTAQTAGRALFINALVLVGGFATMLAARFYPQVKLGALVSSTMVICYVTTMLLFPAVLRLRYRGMGSGPITPGVIGPDPISGQARR